jgi:hypothetical protein
MLRAFAAGFDAFLHAAKALAIIRTFVADFGALPANVMMVRRIHQHELRRCPADFGAGHHQRKVIFLGVFASQFEAIVHRSRRTYLIAAQTLVDAALHFLTDVKH